ncbi:uncharacterized protein LOC110769718, partial [Prunus avium]|uniref:Uncharacterized protein LOC110769718 n=1 Tax=Prunus avium TaxID=42229 RepID=A0A6P5TQM4_PRUAV
EYPPSDGFVKVITDAAWIKERNRSGVGVVIRDSAGIVCGGLADNLYCCSALHAEAEAAVRGLSLAKRKDFSKVMLETDSTILKRSVEGMTNNGAWSILPTILEIRRLANSFQSVEWSWIPRSINKRLTQRLVLASERWRKFAGLEGHHRLFREC